MWIPNTKFNQNPFTRRHTPLLWKHCGTVFLSIDILKIKNVRCVLFSLTLTFLHFLAAIDLDFFLSDSREEQFI